MIKDPYNFDFLTLGPDLLERDLERSLIQHVRDLILKLGRASHLLEASITSKSAVRISFSTCFFTI